jgi:homoserine kinase
MLAAEVVPSLSVNDSTGVYELQVPGSVANLGPGFDTLGVAVELYLKLRAQILPGQKRIAL